MNEFKDGLARALRSDRLVQFVYVDVDVDDTHSNPCETAAGEIYFARRNLVSWRVYIENWPASLTALRVRSSTMNKNSSEPVTLTFGLVYSAVAAVIFQYLR